MRILITGASGFIGSALTRRLTLDALHQPIPSHTRLTPDASWNKELTGIEQVIHCAALIGNASDADLNTINVEGTLTLARQAAQAGIKRFIFLSSIKVNGETTLSGKPFTPDDPPTPQDAYATSKHEAEQALFALAQGSDMELVILRPPLVYGPGVKGNIALLMKLIACGIPLPLGGIHNARSMVALDNLVDLILHCVTHPHAANQVFLVSDGIDMSTPALLQHLARAMNRPCRVFACPPQLLEFAARLLGKSAMVHRLCDNLQVDIAKTRELLDWSPPIGLEEAFRRTVFS